MFIPIPSEIDEAEIMAQRKERVASDPNQLSKWFRAVEKAGVPTPETHIFRMSLDLQMAMLNASEGGVAPDAEAQAEIEALVTRIADQVDRWGGRGFLRTGSTSGKHDWANTCFLPDSDPATIRQHLAALVTFVYMAGAPESDEIVVRELIDTSPAFMAFEGMPVTREFRLFVDPDGLIGHQFYWPAEAFKHEKHLEGSDWRSSLAKMSGIEPEVLADLADKAVKVVRQLGGAWSVDFLQARDGRWLLIDMADMYASYIDHDGVTWTRNPADQPGEPTIGP